MLEVHSARALARYHRGAECTTGRALVTERLALMWLDKPLQDFTAATQRRFGSVDGSNIESVLGIEVSIAVAQSPTTLLC